LVWSWNPAEMYRAGSLVTDWRNMAEFGQAFLRPDFHEWRGYLEDMMVTVQIALWGTALAAVLGAPFAILSSSNIAPQWVVQPVRRLMDSCRAINEIVFALLFVVAVGLGPFAGVMALFVHNTGVFSKLYSEAVEAIDPRPVEGIRATGARRIPEIVFGVIPQVVPLWSSFILYRLETNVRSATTLGIVGAGGIGQTLYESIRSFHYAETAAQMIIVVVTVIAIDLFSARLRKALV
jgi:phosphonate transport system permease protein